MSKEDYLNNTLIQLNSGFGLFIIHKNVCVRVCLHFIWHECAVFLNYRLFKYQHYESGERQSPRAHRLARLTDLACVTNSRFSGRYCFKKKKTKQRWTVSEKLLRLTSIFYTFVHTHTCSFPMNTHRKCVYYIYSCIHDMH